MKTLRVTQLKPNPTGKDRTPSGSASPAQLGAEWVDFENTGSAAVNLTGVELYHVAYGPGGKSEWSLITRFSSGTLRPGESVRVHSGRQRDLSVLYEEDQRGATYHTFSGEDRYVWNNDKGDTAGLFDSNGRIDKASYDPYPLEGVILVRSGDTLLALTGMRRY